MLLYSGTLSPERSRVSDLCRVRPSCVSRQSILPSAFFANCSVCEHLLGQVVCHSDIEYYCKTRPEFKYAGENTVCAVNHVVGCREVLAAVAIDVVERQRTGVVCFHHIQEMACIVVKAQAVAAVDEGKQCALIETQRED